MSSGAERALARPAIEPLLDEHLPNWARRESDAVSRGEARLPAETVRELRRSGVLAAPIPSALGGLGAELADIAALVRRVAGHAPSTALCLAMPLANAANARVDDAFVAPADRADLQSGRAWIATRALRGEILAVANSEPGAQGNLANTGTKATRDARGRITLTGDKSFATFGPDADYFLCTARTDAGLDAFFVARDAPGVQLAEDWDALGMRLSASVSLRLEAAEAAAPFLYPGAIGKANARHWSTLLLAAVFVGVAEGALAAAQQLKLRLPRYARASLAEHALALDAARGFIEAVARDDQIPCPAPLVERARRAKTFAAKSALALTTAALALTGGHAYRAGHPLARFMLDAAAGPLLRPPLAQAMDALAVELFGAD